MDNYEKHRINLYISNELLSRLETCSKRFGVSRAQMAVVLIGQGVASIEEAFTLSKEIGTKITDDIKELK